MTCLEISNISLPGCKNQPEIWGTFMHGVHNVPPDLGHINEILKWFA